MRSLILSISNVADLDFQLLHLLHTVPPHRSGRHPVLPSIRTEQIRADTRTVRLRHGIKLRFTLVWLHRRFLLCALCCGNILPLVVRYTYVDYRIFVLNTIAHTVAITRSCGQRLRICGMRSFPSRRADK